MSSVAVEVAEQEAERAGRGLVESGYRADFTVAGLAELDRFFDDHAPGGVPTPSGLLAEHTGGRVFALAAYLGETLRRQFAGTWRQRPGAEADPTAVEVVLPDGRVVQPVEWVFHRLKANPPGGLARLGWLLLDHRVMAPADGRSWLSPHEAAARLVAAVPGLLPTTRRRSPTTTRCWPTCGRPDAVPAEVLAEVEQAAAGIRYVTVTDPASGVKVELDIAPEDRIAVHHLPAATPVVEACARALGYALDKIDLPPIPFPTAAPPLPPAAGLWAKARRLFGG